MVRTFTRLYLEIFRTFFLLHSRCKVDSQKTFVPANLSSSPASSRIRTFHCSIPSSNIPSLRFHPLVWSVRVTVERWKRAATLISTVRRSRYILASNVHGCSALPSPPLPPRPAAASAPAEGLQTGVIRIRAINHPSRVTLYLRDVCKEQTR